MHTQFFDFSISFSPTRIQIPSVSPLSRDLRSLWRGDPSKKGSFLWALIVLCVFPFFSTSSFAQPAFPGAPDDLGINVRVYPTTFWGPRAGPGVGLGLVVHNLARRHDQWLLTAAPALHEQVATASFATSNPRKARRYLLVGTRALHTDADWRGPASDRTVLERSSLRTRVRIGQAMFDRRLLLQPHLAVSHHTVDAVRQANGASTDAVVHSSLPTPGTQQTGLRLGADIRFDTRNHAQLATSGVLLQSTWARYRSLDDTNLRFDQVDVDAYGYVPLGGDHRLVTRLSITDTHSRTETSIPVYMLPTLGGTVVPGWARGRFAAADRLLAGTLYRFPLTSFMTLVTLEGHVGGHLAGAYANLRDQFTTRVSFDENVSVDDQTTPLRPAASAGLRLVTKVHNRSSIDLAVGVSPEGITAVRFSFERSLQTLRPPHHSSHSVR